MLYEPRKINNLRVVVVCLLIVGAFASYNFFFMQHAVAQDATSDTTAPADTGVTSSEDAIISKITSISLDTSLFSNPAFESLTDRSVVIPQSPAGKTNPFAPFPGSTKTTPSHN